MSWGLRAFTFSLGRLRVRDALVRRLEEGTVQLNHLGVEGGDCLLQLLLRGLGVL